MTAVKRKGVPDEGGAAVGSIALLASILANVKQHGDKEELKHSVLALQRLVQDWQFAYGTLDAQLALALRTNEEQSRLITSLRGQLLRLQDRVNDSERRLLEVEAGREGAAPRLHGATPRSRKGQDP
jgi:chromosome segregation ATPase